MRHRGTDCFDSRRLDRPIRRARLADASENRGAMRALPNDYRQAVSRKIHRSSALPQTRATIDTV
jgi:hypothetical protein